MDYDYDFDFGEITNKLDFWLTEQLPNSYIFLDNNKNIGVNLSLLKLENWLLDWKKKNKLNQRIDASIFSDNIVKHTGNNKSENAYQADDYQLLFLHYLTMHYNAKSSLFAVNGNLYAIIDSFVEEYKEQLTLADIIITNTGATRAKTNLRFTLTKLREYGLVLSRDKANKRIWKPSIPGIMVLLNIQKNGLQFNNLLPSMPCNRNNTLQPAIEKGGNKKQGEFCNTFSAFIRQFREEGYLYTFLDFLTQLHISKVQKDTIKQIMDRYINFTENAIKITDKGISFTKNHKTLSNEFQKEIFTNHEENKDLHEILFVCYQLIINKKRRND